MKIAVFMSSRKSEQEIFSIETTKLGKILSESSHKIWYGGEDLGTMTVFADAFEGAKNLHGATTCSHIDQNVHRKDLISLKRFTNFTERKLYFYTTCDAFIALPGGIGTFDEIFGLMTYNYENNVAKPLILIDIMNYYSKVFESPRSAQFFYPETMKNLYFISSVSNILNKLEEVIKSEKA